MKSLSRVLVTQRRTRLTVDATADTSSTQCTTDTNSTPKTDSDNMLHRVCNLVNDGDA